MQLTGVMSRESRFWLRYIGSGAITLVSILIVALLWRGIGAIPDPGLILLFTVAASTYLAGGMAGMLSAAIVLVGSFVLFSHPDNPFRYSELDWRQMMFMVVACPVIALMVGSLREQVDRLKTITQETAELRNEIRRLEGFRDGQYLCEQRLRTLVDLATDYAAFTVDATGAVTTWNAGAERVLGYNDPEIIGQSYSRFFIKQDLLAQHPDRLIGQARLSGRAEQEGWRVRKGGGRLRARTSIIPLKTAQGTPAGYVVVIHDFTQLEDANLAALKAQVELEAIKRPSGTRPS